jgi:hypothetical protein
MAVMVKYPSLLLNLRKRIQKSLLIPRVEQQKAPILEFQSQAAAGKSMRNLKIGRNG